MKQIATMCSEEELKKLASRSNFRYGQEIYKDGEIVFLQDEALHKVARVNFRSNETRTVDVLSTPKGLKWKCTCKIYFVNIMSQLDSISTIQNLPKRSFDIKYPQQKTTLGNPRVVLIL